MNIKKFFLGLLLILWMIIIFLFSSQNAIKSQKVSDHFTSSLVDIFSSMSNHQLTEKFKKNFIKNIGFFVRKVAHFSLYFILGIIIFSNFQEYKLKNIILLSILFCFLYACSDEFHQMFSSGRSAQFLDVLLDTGGSICGIFFIQCIQSFFK